jgi:hypothetical protein
MKQSQRMMGWAAGALLIAISAVFAPACGGGDSPSPQITAGNGGFSGTAPDGGTGGTNVGGSSGAGGTSGNGGTSGSGGVGGSSGSSGTGGAGTGGDSGVGGTDADAGGAGGSDPDAGEGSAGYASGPDNDGGDAETGTGGTNVGGAGGESGTGGTGGTIIVPCPADCSGHGTCDTSNGVCTCATGFAGAACDQCAVGYKSYPTCYAIQTCPANCSGHGTCNDQTGVCTCATGFAGTACDVCAAGYANYPTCYQVTACPATTAPATAPATRRLHLARQDLPARPATSARSGTSRTQPATPSRLARRIVRGTARATTRPASAPARQDLLARPATSARSGTSRTQPATPSRPARRTVRATARATTRPAFARATRATTRRTAALARAATPAIPTASPSLPRRSPVRTGPATARSIRSRLTAIPVCARRRHLGNQPFQHLRHGRDLRQRHGRALERERVGERGADTDPNANLQRDRYKRGRCLGGRKTDSASWRYLPQNRRQLERRYEPSECAGFHEDLGAPERDVRNRHSARKLAKRHQNLEQVRVNLEHEQPSLLRWLHGHSRPLGPG